MESDLGNVGVQRPVVGYERVEGFLDPGPTWLAELACGHKVKLTAEPSRLGVAAGGRHMDCPDCTRLAKAQS